MVLIFLLLPSACHMKFQIFPLQDFAKLLYISRANMNVNVSLSSCLEHLDFVLFAMLPWCRLANGDKHPFPAPSNEI